MYVALDLLRSEQLNAGQALAKGIVYPRTHKVPTASRRIQDDVLGLLCTVRSGRCNMYLILNLE